MKKIIPILALCAIAASAPPTQPIHPKDMTPQQRQEFIKQRRAEAAAKEQAAKLGPKYDVQLAPGVMVTISSTNKFTSSEAAQILRQAAIKIQTNR